jgi:Dynein heavy chain, N-terminal region 2
VKAEVDRQEAQLRLFADTLDEWLACQKLWIHLSTIFGAADIQRQLPAETKAFVSVDRQYRDVMRRTKSHCNALQVEAHPCPTPFWDVPFAPESGSVCLRHTQNAGIAALDRNWQGGRSHGDRVAPRMEWRPLPSKGWWPAS